MKEEAHAVVLMRRTLLRTARWGSMAIVGLAVLPRRCPGAPAAADDKGPDETIDEDVELIRRLMGRTPTVSPRIRLEMPPIFANGYTVPLSLDIDSPMTELDHVHLVRIVAPRNPIIEVASFHFTARSGRARVSTRIRLAKPQNVLAAAEMNDGTLLMTKTWVKVDTNGCA
jgi:sulfur-oxidizing protein SoxY